MKWEKYSFPLNYFLYMLGREICGEVHSESYLINSNNSTLVITSTESSQGNHLIKLEILTIQDEILQMPGKVQKEASR